MKARYSCRIAWLFACACMVLTIRAEAASYDPSADFSISNGNPNGVWSYGWMTTDFAVFTPYANVGQVAGLCIYWWGWNTDHSPSIGLNQSGSEPWSFAPPGWLAMHPGNGFQPSVLRWQAPASAQYELVGQFLPGDSGQMSVGVRAGATWLWQAADAGSFDITRFVQEGQFIDLVVYGGYAYGATPLKITINTVAPVVTQFGSDGWLVWSNKLVGLYAGVQIAWDIHDPVWCPIDPWDVLTTTQVTNFNLGTTTNDWPHWIAYVGAPLSPAFFRVVVATNPLPVGIWTNVVQLRNIGSSALSNLVVTVLQGAAGQTNQVAELLPGQSTVPLLFTQPMDWFIDSGPRMELRAGYQRAGTVQQVDFIPTVLPYTQAIGN